MNKSKIKSKNILRCPWCGSSEKMIQYHDEEWGVIVRDDKKLFEYLVLDTFQAGLSWSTILHRREGFKNAFANFDVKKVARFTELDYNRLLQDEGIIRNKLKIRATISNAQAFINIQKEYGSFSEYIWQFSDGKPIINKWIEQKDVPSRSQVSDAMSKSLKKRGFKFVGSTICYAFMQASGMVNDHLSSCFRYNTLS
jgi:DNA-3-methyladenine glycosylase I